MKSRTLQWIGMGLILAVGAIHLYLAPEESEEAAYMGALFALNFVAALAAAAGLRRDALWGWLLGFYVAAGSIYGYILTRSVGMPGMEVEEWLYAPGIAALLLEGAFLAVFALRRPLAPLNERWAYLLPASLLSAVLLFGALGWIQGAQHERTEEMLKVADLVSISPEALEEQFGLEVLLVGVSMEGSIVDLRLKVLDADKAAPLLAHAHPMLLVGDGKQQLIGRSMHHHTQRLKDGGMVYVFFPNRGAPVRRGMRVALALGNIRVDALPAQ